MSTGQYCWGGTSEGYSGLGAIVSLKKAISVGEELRTDVLTQTIRCKVHFRSWQNNRSALAACRYVGFRVLAIPAPPLPPPIRPTTPLEGLRCLLTP